MCTLSGFRFSLHFPRFVRDRIFLMVIQSRSSMVALYDSKTAGAEYKQ